MGSGRRIIHCLNTQCVNELNLVAIKTSKRNILCFNLIVNLIKAIFNMFARKFVILTGKQFDSFKSP